MIIDQTYKDTYQKLVDIDHFFVDNNLVKRKDSWQKMWRKFFNIDKYNTYQSILVPTKFKNTDKSTLNTIDQEYLKEHLELRCRWLYDRTLANLNHFNNLIYKQEFNILKKEYKEKYGFLPYKLICIPTRNANSGYTIVLNIGLPVEDKDQHYFAQIQMGGFVVLPIYYDNNRNLIKRTDIFLMNNANYNTFKNYFCNDEVLINKIFKEQFLLIDQVIKKSIKDSSDMSFSFRKSNGYREDSPFPDLKKVFDKWQNLNLFL